MSLITLVSMAASSAVGVQPAFPYSWDKISTYAFPGHINRYFTDVELQHFSQFSLLLYWGIDIQPDPTRGPGWWLPQQEDNSIRQAAIKAINPNILLFPYITGFMAQTWFEAQWQFDQPGHEAWWLADPATGAPIDCNNTKANVCYGYSQGAPGKLYDWRLPEVRDYFVNQVIAPYVDNANISGLFLDDTTDVATRCMVPPHGQTPCTGSWTFTAEEQLDFTNATMVHLDAALSSMQAHGKTAIVSTEVTATSTPLNSSTFDKMLMQHGAMHYNEFFEGSQSDIVSALGTTTAGGAFMVHALGSDDFAQREYPLAAFLIVAGEFSYWGMGNGWSIGSFPWYPEFDRPLGKPLGPATETSPGAYFRQFEALNVSVNTNTKEASILWHGLGPIPGPPTPPPVPPPPPFGKYTATAETIVFQNPPSYSLIKQLECGSGHSADVYSACVNASAAACDTTPGCTAFSVLSPSYDGHVYAELSPKPAADGQFNKYWTTYQKSAPTPGSWHNTSQPKEISAEE